MTVGAVALMALQQEPIRPQITQLAAVAQRTDGPARSVFQTRAEFAEWHNVVVHASSDAQQAGGQVHFIVSPDGRANPTDLWQTQRAGQHITSNVDDYNADSIAICLAGDFSRSRPTAEQLKALVSLVQTLQQTFQIGPDRIYLASEIPGGSPNSPGPGFPAQLFARTLLNI